MNTPSTALRRNASRRDTDGDNTGQYWWTRVWHARASSFGCPSGSAVASLAVVFPSSMGTDTGASNLREPRDVANFTDKVPLHLTKTSPPDEYADFTKEYGPPARKNNATNDFQHEVAISKSL